MNGKRNGKGKEYYNGELILEGEFLNGKYNGKIKKYESNKPKYVEMIPNEDEFVTIGYSTERNDEKTKKGESDKFIIEEEYLEGKKWEYKAYNEEDGQERGKGKEYYWNNELIYEGEYLNRKRHGKGKEYRLGKLIFEGEYINGRRWKRKRI